MTIWNVAVIVGGMLMIGGMLANFVEQSRSESRDARAVRAFFKAYTDDTRVSYTRPAADGSTDWVIDVRSLSDANKAYTAVPIELLTKLSADTGMVTPWPDIIVDPKAEAAPAQEQPK